MLGFFSRQTDGKRFTDAHARSLPGWNGDRWRPEPTPAGRSWRPARSLERAQVSPANPIVRFDGRRRQHRVDLAGAPAGCFCTAPPSICLPLLILCLLFENERQEWSIDDARARVGDAAPARPDFSFSLEKRELLSKKINACD
jgi:hypothetical protein